MLLVVDLFILARLLVLRSNFNFRNKNVLRVRARVTLVPSAAHDMGSLCVCTAIIVVPISCFVFYGAQEYMLQIAVCAGSAGCLFHSHIRNFLFFFFLLDFGPD